MESHTELDLYLEEVAHRLNLDPDRSAPIIRELRSHLLEIIEDGEESGLSREVALGRAIDSFGRPRTLARLLYESHRKTSWAELGVAALPHLMIAVLFAIGGWASWVWSPLLLLPIVLVTLYGWWQGRVKGAFLEAEFALGAFPDLLQDAVPVFRGLADQGKEEGVGTPAQEVADVVRRPAAVPFSQLHMGNPVLSHVLLRSILMLGGVEVNHLWSLRRLVTQQVCYRVRGTTHGWICVRVGKDGRVGLSLRHRRGTLSPLIPLSLRACIDRGEG